jgi:Ca2+-binding RTX toxin-like protein
MEYARGRVRQRIMHSARPRHGCSIRRSAARATTCSRAARTSTTWPAAGATNTAYLGDSFDRFSWNPGDGNDVVEGGPGHDSLTFNGTDAAEVVELSADGRRLRVTRDGDSTVTYLGSVEEINHSPRGGADRLRVGDLSRTPVELLHANMGAGFPTGDGATDTIELSATPGSRRRMRVHTCARSTGAPSTGASAWTPVSS